MKKTLKILISGGGTGGHIFPAIAIADLLKERYPNAEIQFVGAKNRMEMQRVPEAGYAIIGLWISGFNRQTLWKNASFPLKLLFSIFKSWLIILRFKPNVVIGTGGFASGALLYVASLKHVPTLIQEQNAYPGITNKLLGAKVDKICVAYDGLARFFPKHKIVKTGNPIRKNLLEKASSKDAIASFGLSAKRKTLLILGGSLGAARIDQLVFEQLSFFEKQGIQLIWQTGKGYFDKYRDCANPHAVVRPFLKDMQKAYAAADFIIARAGAGGISELTIIGKPVLFIPSPNVAENHQVKNAQTLEKANAAMLIEERDLGNFTSVFSEFIKEDKQQQLAANIRDFALPNATQAIVDEIDKLINL